MSGEGKTVLVTGAAGYVATHCIVELLEVGFDIVGFDNYSNSVPNQSDEGETEKDDIDRRNVPESFRRIEKLTGKSLKFEQVDLCDQAGLKEAMAKHKIDCVLHAAGSKAVGESVKNPLMYYRNNVIGSYNLIKVMDDLGIKKIVFSSSSTVYGIPQRLPMDENHPAGNCTNPYGKTKFFVEEIIKDMCSKDEEWSAMLLRYFNPVGAHPSGEIGEDPLGVPYNLMPFVAQVAVGRRDKLTVFGTDYATVDGTAVNCYNEIRDYVHVMDVASGHVTAMLAMFKSGFSGAKVYNLGIGKGTSVYELVNAFEEASGIKIPTELSGRRKGDVEASFASCELIEKELGWKAQKTILDMCKDMWTWQSKNNKGYRKNVTDDAEVNEKVNGERKE